MLCFDSGEYKTPGAPLAPDNGPLQSIEAADPGLVQATLLFRSTSFAVSCLVFRDTDPKDENGRVFDRRHDADAWPKHW